MKKALSDHSIKFTETFMYFKSSHHVQVSNSEKQPDLYLLKKFGPSSGDTTVPWTLSPIIGFHLKTKKVESTLFCIDTKTMKNIAISKAPTALLFGTIK